MESESDGGHKSRNRHDNTHTTSNQRNASYFFGPSRNVLAVLSLVVIMWERILSVRRDDLSQNLERPHNEKMDMDTREELREASGFLKTAKGPRVRAALSALVATLDVEAKALAEKSPVEPVAPENEPDSSAAVPRTEPEDAARDVANGTGVKQAAEPPPPTKVPVGQPAAPKAGGTRYAAFDKFAWDQGGYNSPKVSVYVPLAGVGTVKERVACSFTSRGFDLTVTDLAGKNYRLVQNNLDKDIIPDKSGFIVKKDKIVVKLAKTKAEYGGFEQWNSLAAKKTRSANKTDPSAGIMDMMKDMYDEGDDSMKKVIGEAMMKTRTNPKGRPEPSFPPPSHGSSDSFGKGLGGLGGSLGAGMGSLDQFDDNLDSDLGAGGFGKDDWGLGGNDDGDFGFGKKMPPPEANEPLPNTSEEHEEEEEEKGEGAAVKEGKPSDVAGGADGVVGEPTVDPMEALDD